MSELWVFVLLIGGFLYFTPAIIASNRNHQRHGGILVLNLLLEWTVLGWIVALVWSLSAIGNGATAASSPIATPIGIGTATVPFKADGIVCGRAYRKGMIGEVIVLLDEAEVRIESLDAAKSALS